MTLRSISFSLSFVVALLFIGRLPLCTADTASETPFRLVRATDPGPTHAVPAGARIAHSPVKLGDSVLLATILVQRGVQASMDTYALIYEDNPSLRDLADLHSGDTVVLPELTGGEEVAVLKREGYIAVPTAFEEQRKRIAAEVQRFQSAQEPLAAGWTQVHGPEKARAALSDNLERIGLRLRLIRENLVAQPQSIAVLRHVAREAARAAGIAEAIRKSGDFTEGQAQIAASLVTELGISLEGFGSGLGPTTPPPRWRSQPVRAIVRRAGSVQALSGYRVRYQSQGAFMESPETDPEEFRLSTPNATDDVPEGTFLFWAVKEGTVRRVTYPVEKHTIRMNGQNREPIVIELILKEGKQ